MPWLQNRNNDGTLNDMQVQFIQMHVTSHHSSGLASWKTYVDSKTSICLLQRGVFCAIQCTCTQQSVFHFELLKMFFFCLEKVR